MGNKEITDLAQQIYSAQSTGTPSPRASDFIEDLDAEKAFAIQKALVEEHLAKKTVYGYKAGLTTAEAQQRFGVDQPVAGVLFAYGHKAPGDTVYLSDFNNMAVETELGYFLTGPVDQPISSLESLKERVRYVLPVLEFPNAAFGAEPTAHDIISANAGSAFYITGPKYSPDDIDVNTLEVTLHRGSTLMNTGVGSDALGSQWAALLWLVNKMVAQGYTVGPDDLLITGALGSAFPGEEGDYTANYGVLGKVAFHIY